MVQLGRRGHCDNAHVLFRGAVVETLSLSPVSCCFCCCDDDDDEGTSTVVGVDDSSSDRRVSPPNGCEGSGMPARSASVT